MVQQEMTLFKFLPQDNKKHQEEQAPGPAPQTAAVPQAALKAFCQSHTRIPTLRLKASEGTTFASRQKLHKTCPEEESKLSSRNLWVSRGSTKCHILNAHSQKPLLAQDVQGPAGRGTIMTAPTPPAGSKPREKSRQSTDFVCSVSEEKTHQEKK